MFEEIQVHRSPGGGNWCSGSLVPKYCCQFGLNALMDVEAELGSQYTTYRLFTNHLAKTLVDTSQHNC